MEDRPVFLPQRNENISANCFILGKKGYFCKIRVVPEFNFQQIMAGKKAQEQLDPEVKIQSAIGNTENYIMRNGPKLLTALIVIFVIVGGIYGYKYCIAAPRAERAASMMFMAEQYFVADSFDLALNGDGNFDGFLRVIDRYGSTRQGNLAQHYAGICYLQLGQYEDALAHLKKFKAPKGVPNKLLEAQNYGLRGDVYTQLQDYKKAIAMYQKAIDVSDNALTAPYYLKKLGLVQEKLGNNDKALEAYRMISESYATSVEARDIQKYIGRLEQL